MNAVKRYQAILVPIDGSDNSKMALMHAVYLAQQCNAELHLLHVVSLVSVLSHSIYSQGHYNLVQEVEDAFKDTGSKILDEALAAVPSSLRTYAILETGAPPQVILNCIGQHKIDLIVMGSRGLGLVKGLFMGSVSSHVMQQASIPVLIVK